MAEKYQNRYRIASARAAWWDYSRDGAYFVTICTDQRVHCFGHIDNGTMHLSPEGQLARDTWLLIPEQFDFADLAAFVIMPDHLHGIIVIRHPDGGDTVDGDTDMGDVNHMDHLDSRDAINRVSANANANADGADFDSDFAYTNTINPGGVTGRHNPMLHRNLSRIIRWYKGRTTFECRKLNPDFRWQARFHDHIIRDQASFDRISQYIHQNPAKWTEDKHR